MTRKEILEKRKEIENELLVMLKATGVILACMILGILSTMRMDRRV